MSQRIFLDILKFLKLDKSTKVQFVTDHEKGITKPLRQKGLTVTKKELQNR